MKRMFLAVAVALGLAAHASLNTTLDCTSLTFTTGGDANWFEQSDDVKVGATALRSGAITHSQETWVKTEAPKVGTVSFWWKVSSESVSFDYLVVYIGGIGKAKIGGTGGDWTRVSIPVVSGQTIQWLYVKDGGDSDGSDCGWLDGVEFMPARPDPRRFARSNGTGTRRNGRRT